jgi:hypothetical protein
MNDVLRAIKFNFKHLALCMCVCDCITLRIRDYCMCTPPGVLQYQHSPSAREAVTNDVLMIPSKAVIRKFFCGPVTCLDNRLHTAAADQLKAVQAMLLIPL